MAPLTATLVILVLCGANEALPAPFRLVRYSQDHRTLQLDQSFIARPLRIGSRTYRGGLGTHSVSSIEIKLGDKCRELRTDVGVDFNDATRKAGGSAVFIVRVNGKGRFRSGTLRPGMDPVSVSIDLSMGRQLELIVSDANDGYVGDHANWANARIVMTDGSETPLSTAFRKQGLPRQSLSRVKIDGTPEPPTRTLRPAEAQKALERDWLFQANGSPTAQRIRQEIEWTRELAARIARNPVAPDLSADLAEIESLQRRLPGAKEAPQSPAIALTDGLIASWRFDGADGGRRSPGVFGHALELAANGHVRTPTKFASIAGGNYTICVWLKTTADVVDILGNGVGPGHLLLVLNRGPVRVHHWTETAGSVADGKTPVNDGRWHHVAQVVDDTRVSLYVDGEFDVTKNLKGKRIATDDPILIGSSDPSRSRYRFRGALDDVLVYDRALSQEELGRLHAQGAAVLKRAEQSHPELYLAVRRVKRHTMLRNPAIDFTRVVFVDVPYPATPHESMHRVYPQAQQNCGRLLILDGLHPGGAVRKLAGPKPGMFWRFDLSFDARKVIFCYRPEGDRTFHLYEIGIGGDGLKQLTSGSYDDLDPIYLPDGHIMFMSNRGNSYARCAVGHPSPVLARCDANGKDIYLVSASNEPEYTPALMPNGRVLYTRWEYTDKELMRIQSLWTVNPDGTGVSAYWGNQSFWPDMLVEARPMPGSNRVMFAGHGHHDVFKGSIGIIDQNGGFNYPDGLTKVTPDLPWPEVGNGPEERLENGRYHASGSFAGYKSPFPLSEEVFLVSARVGTKGSATQRDRRRGLFKLYLMDLHGNRELIYEGVHNVLYALPVRPRPRPPVIPDTVAWPGSQSEGGKVEPGQLYSANVLEGMPAAVREEAKYLRVINLDYTTFTFGLKAQGPGHWKSRPHMHAGPPLSITGNDGIKRILGTVPIEADGSVYFEAPPCKQLHFQLLDEHFRALQTMRSFTNLMPGERRGCLGCHELHSIAPSPEAGLAFKKQRVKPTPPPWGPHYSMGYERDIQPILDRHCGSCHQGKGKARGKLDLTLRPSKDAGVFPEPYVTLTLGKERNLSGHFPRHCEGGIAGTILPMVGPNPPEEDRTIPPMTTLSYRSKLIHVAVSGKHNGVKLDPLGLRKLIVWVDTLCPYRGEAEIRNMPDPDPEVEPYRTSHYPPTDCRQIHRFADSPYPPRMKTAPVVERAYCQDEFPTQAHRLKARQRAMD